MLLTRLDRSANKATGSAPRATVTETIETSAPSWVSFSAHSAFMYWNNSGTVIDEKGEHSRYPTTDEGWDILVTGATMLVEAGNALQLPGRTRAPEAEWTKYAQMLSERAMIARAAAEKHDQKAVFDEGGRVYEVCVACHERFIIEPQLKAEGVPKGAPLPAIPEGKAK